MASASAFVCVEPMETVTSWEKLFKNMVESTSEDPPTDQLLHGDKFVINESTRQ